MRHLSVLALLTACTAVSPSTDLFVDMDSTQRLDDVFPTGDVAGPPLPLDLTMLNTVFQRGEQASFTVTGAPAGRVVALVVGQDTGAPGACPAILSPECLDVPAPYFVVAQNLADANGEIQFDLPIPADLRPDNLIFQAVSIRGSRIFMSSPVQTRVIDPYLDVSAAYVNYVFRYDADFDTAGAYGSADVYPYVRLNLLSDAFIADPTNTDERCSFDMSASFPLGRASWANTEPDLVFGFEWPLGTDWTDNCVDRLDPARFGDIEAALEQASWGIGVLDDLDPAIEAFHLNNGATQAQVDARIGAFWGGTWGALSTNQRGSSHTIYAIEQNGDLVYDAAGNLVLLPRANALVGGQLQDAVLSGSVNINVPFLESL